MGKEGGKRAECCGSHGSQKASIFKNAAGVGSIQDNLLERGNPGL